MYGTWKTSLTGYKCFVVVSQSCFSFPTYMVCCRFYVMLIVVCLSLCWLLFVTFFIICFFIVSKYMHIFVIMYTCMYYSHLYQVQPLLSWHFRRIVSRHFHGSGVPLKMIYLSICHLLYTALNLPSLIVALRRSEIDSPSLEFSNFLL